MTWTAPEIARPLTLKVGDERALLTSWLDFHRQTLLLKCAGLTAEQLIRREVPPSALTLLGLVRHMTEVERWWFRRRAAGEELTDVFCTEESPDGDFDDVGTADAAADIATFQQECRLAEQAVANIPLDSTFSHPRGDHSLRWVYLHMIEEYARHNGHADLIRERVDGVTGD